MSGFTGSTGFFDREFSADFLLIRSSFLALTAQSDSCRDNCRVVAKLKPQSEKKQ